MRGKDFSTGLRGGLFESQHYSRMGSAIWLYGWLVLRQTKQHRQTGWVLGGAAITYREIEEETGFNCRTLERWMQNLRRSGYIETDALPSGIVVRITKAKKFPQAMQGAPKYAERARKFAEGSPQTCVASTSQNPAKQKLTQQIGSSLIARLIEKQNKNEIHRDFHSPSDILNQNPTRNPKPSWLGQTKTPTGPGPEDRRREQLLAEARLQRELLRVQREEETQRELKVGTGPELRRG